MNKKLKIVVFLAWVAMSLFIIFSLQSIIFFRGIMVRFDYQQRANIEYQVFYTTKTDDIFSQAYSVKKTFPAGNGKAEIFLPSVDIERFRLDIGSCPGSVIIRNLQLSTPDCLYLTPSLFRCNQIDSYTTSTGSICLTSQKKDPYITYKPRLGLRGVKGVLRCNYFYLFLALFVPFYIITLISDARKTMTMQITTIRRNKKTSTLCNIEFLRILFTFFILIFHFFSPFKIWSSGAQGVQFFFLLSGYLLALSYKPERKIADFAVARYIRFVPLTILGGILAGGEWKSFMACLMLQNTGLSFGDIPNVPAWYIAVLFWCSLFYLLLMKNFPRKSAMAMVATIGFVAMAMMVQTPGIRCELFAGCITRGMLQGFSCMAIGILMAQFCRRGVDEQLAPKQKLVYSLAELIVLLYLLWGCFDQTVFPKSWSVRIVGHVVLLYLFILKRGYISDFFEKEIFAKLAKYCLAIYLTHIFFVTTLHQYIQSHCPGWFQEHVISSIIIAMVGSCVLGIFSYHLVEVPCTRYASGFLKWMKIFPVSRN